MGKSERALRSVKGMNDVLPGARQAFLDAAVWDHIHQTTGRVLEAYGYRFVRLPAVEETALFARGIGEATDIVGKEMYSFTDRGGRDLSLRPEGTAGAVRAYVEHDYAQNAPLQRWWYAGPMFRAENIQKGRYRQFYQIGAELFGTAEPAADAEMVTMLWGLCAALGIEGVRIRLNSLGDRASRAAYRDVMRAYLRDRAGELCESCRGRIEQNPLRALDCKRPSCREVVTDAPDIAASLSEASAAHFDAVQGILSTTGVPFERDRRLVRGLDYYTGTLFEVTTTALGAQDAVLGGGRYDDLVEELGGPSTPAIGFAAGVERMALLIAEQPVWQTARHGADLYLIPMGSDASATAHAFALADAVRGSGRWRVEVDVGGGRLKQQMRRADRSGARSVIVLGEEEVQSGLGIIKALDVSSGHEERVALDGQAIAAVLRERSDTREIS